MEKLVNVFFGGSRSRAALALLSQETWTDDELNHLSEQIEEVKKSRRTGK
jgi:hypothetical protein